MTEDFIHYIWKYQNFRLADLTSASGQELEVIKPGYHNHNSGPDFLEASIRVGNYLWAGHVEIHVRSSDWYRHGHQTDPAFQNVILHVVYEHDRQVATSDGTFIPVLQLKGRFDEYEYWRFEQLVQSQFSIPCSAHIPNLETTLIEKMLERALCERLEYRESFVTQLWKANQRDWVNTSYQLFGYGQGLKVNADPMLNLTARIPYRILVREAGDPTRLEALLLGVAGLLAEADEYSAKLISLFTILEKKYDIEVMPRSLWRYSRLHSASFPERRIVQMARLIHAVPDLPRLMLDIDNLGEIRQLIGTDLHSEYWENHYRLGQMSKSPGARLTLTPEWIDKLIINVLIPLRFSYARIKGISSGEDIGLSWFEQIKAEKNNITRMMGKLGFRQQTAADSQGALHLYKSYCSPKKCLNCAIGIKILRSE